MTILAVCGLKREAEIAGGPGVVAVTGGGDAVGAAVTLADLGAHAGAVEAMGLALGTVPDGGSGVDEVRGLGAVDEKPLAEGAAGVQVGTAFALCTDSGVVPEMRRALIIKALAGKARVFTDPVASPTGFPFKVA